MNQSDEFFTVPQLNRSDIRGCEPVRGREGSILVVDDDPTSISFLQTVLEGAGYKVLIATDGKTALEKLSIQEIHLILLDVLMSGIDGFETCRRISSDPATSHIPVIFLSALGDTFDKVRGFQVGCEDYLLKPIEPEELLVRIKTHLTLHRLRSDLEFQNKRLQHEIHERALTDDALQRVNRHLTMMNSITRHDIMNKVTILKSFIHLATMCSPNPEIINILHKMRDTTDVISSHIIFTEQYQVMGSCDPTWMDITAILASQQLPDTINADIRLYNLMIYADPLFEKVCYNLIDNTIRYGKKATTITVSYRQDSDGLIIVWEDDGTGIPESDKDVIFERGFGKNTGLGLFLVAEILAITGMTIQETGIEGQGARFEIRVPPGHYRVYQESESTGKV
ncbi:MAG: response regulator [Methanospirillum sp.]|uniref:hybrid sensor histidine kinase/response regulator n=1 Tax=Methanospirillum sp. TaxID=45200 RepID=UPI002370BD6E|nr:response regulator [Methanospirillum sp.]MDD1729266.1 response regulator [Methanospirillum sp.]